MKYAGTWKLLKEWKQSGTRKVERRNTNSPEKMETETIVWMVLL